MYTSIVVGTDGSATAAEAVARAAEVARAFSAPLHLVSAYRLPLTTGAEVVPEAALALADLGDWIVALQVETEALLERARHRLAAEGLKVVSHALPGHPVRAILDVAKAEGADLVVVGNKGMRGAKRILGSVPNSISHHAPCDVLIVHTC
jgi:nucleotide-binding universal stress UspA family protein